MSPVLVMMDYLGLILTCGVPVLLILTGLVVGTLIEQSHLKQLAAREAELREITVTDIKQIPPNVDAAGAILVVGSVVVATDYFRTFTASLKKLIGGEIGFYHRLLGRARREAMCRLLEQARQMNAVAVINVRLETSSVGGLAKNPAPMVEVVAYGTALLPETVARKRPDAPPVLKR